MLKTTASWLALVTLLFTPAVPPNAARAADPEPTIPILTSLTGSGAFLGKQEKLVFDVAQRYLAAHGMRVNLTYYDDASSPQVAVQLANQLIAGGTRVFIGPTLKATCDAVYPLVQKGPLDFCLSPTLHAPPGSFDFTAGTDTWDLDRAVVRFAKLRGWKRIGMLYSSDASGLDANKGYHEILKAPQNRDLSIVAEATFNPTDTSVTAQLARINAAHPDMLLAWTSGTAVAMVLRELSQLGMNVPVFTPFSNMTYTQMQTVGAYVPRQLYFPVPSAVGSQRPGVVSFDPRVEQGLRDFEAAFAAAGLKPDGGVMTSLDALLIVAQALRELGPNASSEQLRSYIAHLHGFVGIDGMYDFPRFPQRGLGPNNALITQWNNELKTWVVVSLPEGTPLQS